MAKVKINVTLDEDLMRRIDEYTEENYLTRSSLISLAATQFLSSAEVAKSIKEIAFSMRKIADTGVVDDEIRRNLEDFERLAKMLAGA